MNNFIFLSVHHFSFPDFFGAFVQYHSSIDIFYIDLSIFLVPNLSSFSHSLILISHSLHMLLSFFYISMSPFHDLNQWRYYFLATKFLSLVLPPFFFYALSEAAKILPPLTARLSSIVIMLFYNSLFAFFSFPNSFSIISFLFSPNCALYKILLPFFFPIFFISTFHIFKKKIFHSLCNSIYISGIVLSPFFPFLLLSPPDGLSFSFPFFFMSQRIFHSSFYVTSILSSPLFLFHYRSSYLPLSYHLFSLFFYF
ncbi:unnamed protein product [Acanthosepion pharaonis]|uniref:Uncharacterized protein n=1 Tax=Acanthosepion pharaonis TaxID=158019 RepID=A0A812D796_ACAPH|nr:unnamed protein product [Sepia pharaonis]